MDVSIVLAQLCARVPGGTARYAAALAGALLATQPRGTRLRGVTARPCPAADDTSLPVVSLGIPDLLLPRLWEHGLPPHPAPRGGVVHAPTLLLPPARRGTGLVVTIHDLVPWTHPQTLTPRGVSFHRRMGERAHRDAAVIVTPTESVARQVRDLLDPAGRVEAVLSGVRVPPAPPDAVQRRARLGCPQRYVLFVGTAEPRKGLDRLVPALADPALAGHGLVVVGPPGWGAVSVADLAARAGVTDRVVVTGKVDEADLGALYAGAAVLALPSRAEGFGFPVLEAMGHGVPVVTSTDPALVEVGGGLSTALADLSPAPLAGALAQAAATADQGRGPRIAHAAAYTWESAARQMWDVYAAAAPPPDPPTEGRQRPPSGR